MKKQLKKMWLIVIMASVLLSGCGENNEKTKDETVEEANNKYLQDLNEGVYYVRHNDNSCDEVYFGNATFDSDDLVESPDNSRIMWYKSDFEKIPTLYAGESLIYKSTEELGEEFVFERFEDFGYSIGLCGLTRTKSGRYSISTNVDERNTYPGGDTDEILLLENETVIIDAISGVKLRAPIITENGMEVGSKLTRCNTIAGFTEGLNYDVDIYDGTNKHTYSFKADVRILGSMEAEITNNYEFESETIINITIPEGYNSGYYLINGQGLFRYVNGESYDENTDFNIPNEKPSEESNLMINGLTGTGMDVSNRQENNGAEPEIDGDEACIDPDSDEDVVQQNFNLDGTGLLTITAELSGVDRPHTVTGTIVTPDNEIFYMNNSGTLLDITFKATVKGTYSILIFNLNGGNADISVDFEEE